MIEFQIQSTAKSHWEIIYETGVRRNTTLNGRGSKPLMGEYNK